MANLSTLLIALVFSFLSCYHNDTSNNVSKESIFFTQLILVSSQSKKESKLADTIKRFIVDDYPVTDQMFGNDTNQNGRKMKSGELYSGDKVWFTNDTLKQTLVFELYTDNHRMVTFHFANADIPAGLIKRMELHTTESKYENIFELANDELKEKYFRGFLKYATKIDRKYFTSDKGFKLGDSKQKALTIYGNPDKKATKDNIEIYEWEYVGENSFDGKTNLKGKPLATASFGHQTTMFFRNNKLIGIVFHNDIP